MAILIVDDSRTNRQAMKLILEKAGYQDLLFAETAGETFQKLGIKREIPDSSSDGLQLDLILLDIILPDMDGRKVCKTIKSLKPLADIPIIIVTALTQMEHLASAFEAGAADYITKPLNEIELLARVRSALKLKYEMDRRKAREKELIAITRKLEIAVQRLNLISHQDGLTGIPNRRSFEQDLETEWSRGGRNARPLSMIIMDIDFFKAYNDFYGHLAGDDCLKKVAKCLSETINRPGDNVYRYGGEEFAAILPETPKDGALAVAENLRQAIIGLDIKHPKSAAAGHVTISVGAAAALPNRQLSPKYLLAAADNALYEAKNSGRNNIKFAQIQRGENQ